MLVSSYEARREIAKRDFSKVHVSFLEACRGIVEKLDFLTVRVSIHEVCLRIAKKTRFLKSSC